MKGAIVLLLTVLSSPVLFAQNAPTWLRYPAISPDGRTIVFAYHGDLYTVPASGGNAKLLIKHAAQELMPVWSRDGKQIAFASNRSGNFDIFVIAANGGVERQLTWHAADEYPSDFSADDQHIIFSAARLDAPSNRQFPSESLPELYAVPASGGRVKQILTTTAEDAKLSKDGRFILYHDRKARENPWRKHQVSSAARDIWMYNTENGAHTQLSDFAGEDRSPVLATDQQQYFYLSEQSGSFNIYQSSIAAGSVPVQISFFKDHPVRFLSMATNNTLCFGYDGDIWTKKPRAHPKKLIIKITSGPKPERKTITIDEASEIAVSPSGKEIAFIERGEVFVADMSGKLVKRITNTPAREAGLSFSSDGRKLLYASERAGNWRIFQASVEQSPEHYFYSAPAIPEKEIITQQEDAYQPAWSPDGKEIAYIANRNTLMVFNCASGQSRSLLTSDQLVSRRDLDQYFEWSPDSKWLLVQFTEQRGGNDEVGIISASGNGELINLTRSGFSDTRPRWMMDGKMILYSTDRMGLHSFDNSGTTQTDLFALFTTTSDWWKFNEGRKKPDIMAATDSSKSAMGLPFTAQDWQNTGKRKERLTAQSGILADALVSKDGKQLYYLAKQEKGYDLWQTDLLTRETKRMIRLNLDEGKMSWDAEQQNIFILSDGEIFKVVPQSAAFRKIAIKTNIDIGPAKERAAMLDHVIRRTAATFYTAGYHGANWLQLGKAYQKYLAGIDNNYDFAEMLNELLGELNVSHTGANYKNNETNTPTGSLGLFYDQLHAGTGVKIAELIPGSPLTRFDPVVQAGDIIVAVDSARITPDRDIDYYLATKSGKRVTLQIQQGNQVRHLSVTAISPSEEADLLYKRWVQQNEKETSEKTNGEWGYIHLYRMNDAAYRNVYDEVMGKFIHCKGIIVDTRFNRGGDLAPELVTFLSGKTMRYNTNDHFISGTEPGFRWNHPSIVIAGEANYSDGHCFVYDYQYLHMGKLIGMPVPGSCTWMTGQTLLDPTLSYSVPTMGVKTVSGKYLENLQTEPDIRIRNDYGEVGKGRDQQLEEAIRQTKLSGNDR